MLSWGWSELMALLTSVGFGVISALVPVINAEAYVIVSQVSAVAGPVPIAVGVGIGQTIGKLMLFLGVRRGKESRFIRHRREDAADRPVGPARARFRAIVAKLLDLIGQKRWGLPIVLLAAVVGIPPAVRRGPARRRDQDAGALVRTGGAGRSGHPLRAGGPGAEWSAGLAVLRQE